MISAVISVNNEQVTKTRNKLLNNHVGYRDCLLLLLWVRFNVFYKVIYNCQNVFDALLSARKRAHNVHKIGTRKVNLCIL